MGSRRLARRACSCAGLNRRTPGPALASGTPPAPNRTCDRPPHRRSNEKGTSKVPFSLPEGICEVHRPLVSDSRVVWLGTHGLTEQSRIRLRSRLSLCVKALGIDFTSRSSRRKPISRIHARSTTTIFAPGALRSGPTTSVSALATPGPWSTGIDSSFGQARRFSRAHPTFEANGTIRRMPGCRSLSLPPAL